MKPFISVLLPTRNRPERCAQAMMSLYDTAQSHENFEILLRNDHDDPRLKEYEELACKEKNIFRLIGERKQGYLSVPEFYNELAEWSNKPWVLFWNDDALMLGKGWDSQLLDIPMRGYYVQPEIHRLGGSTYHRDGNGPMPFVPRGSWKQYGSEMIPTPTDTGMHKLLVENNGWQVRFLNGITLWHQRDNEDILEAHRKV